MQLDRPQRGRSLVPFAAVVCFTVVLLLAPQVAFPALDPLHLAAVSAMVAIGAHLWDRKRHGEPVFVGSRESRLAFALVGWSLLTAPISYWPGGSIALLFGFYLKSVVIFWLLSEVIDTRAKLQRLAAALTALAVPLAATAVRNYLSGAFIDGGAQRELQRIVGYQAPLTANPNDLALMLNLILPLSVALLWIHRQPFVRALLLGAIALDVVAVVTTFSRTGFLTLATVFAGYLWKLRRRPERIWAFGALGVGLCSFFFLPSGYLSHLGTIANISSDPTGSAQVRLQDMAAATGWALRNPLVGSGLGMNVLALNEARGVTWRYVHNVYLEYAADLGLPGLLLFLLLMSGCVACVGRVQRRLQATGDARDLFHLAEGIQLSLAGFAVAAFFHPVGYHFYFYYLGGLALAVRSLDAGSREQPAPRPFLPIPRPRAVAPSAEAA
jgi:O-antigen ligase